MLPKYLWNTNFFDWASEQTDDTFDAIITDPPYTSFRNKIGEDSIGDKTFDVKKFCDECVRLLKPKGIFISFCSIHLMKDYFNYFDQKLKFRCEQIWDKRPTRSWISYGIPLRHIEYIVYFGKGKLDFRYGNEKSGYKRSSFGGKLRETKRNSNKTSRSQYEQIIEYNLKRTKSRSRKRRLFSPDLNERLDHFMESKPVQKISTNYSSEFEKRANHPTQKPPEFSTYFRDLLCEKERILDPCCGSGSLIWAFEKNAIGIDISEWNPYRPPMYNNHKIDDYFKI